MLDRVMITGDQGFIGTATKRLMVGDVRHRWDGNVRQIFGYDLMTGHDIRDYIQLRAFVAEHKPQRILHLAAIARFVDADRQPWIAMETNVLGTANVVDVCKEFHVPLVYASTGSAIMPLNDYDPPYAEDIPARGNSVYGVSKAAGECVVRTHEPHIILRYGHIYGMEKRMHGLIGGFLDRIERGQAPVLYGGKQTNDFVYVDDIARANVLALTAPYDKWGEVYHIGTGEEISAKAAGELICATFGYEGGIERVAQRTVDPSRFVFDVSKAKVMLEWEAEYCFSMGLLAMKQQMCDRKHNG